MNKIWSGDLSASGETRTIKTWRCYLKGEKGEGWALALFDEIGFFSCVSDFGNYAHAWGDFGKRDFREFLLEIDAGYLAGKISGGRREYAAEATLEAVKQHIVELRRDRSVSKDFAREEWDRLSECDNLDSEPAFVRWYDQTGIDDAGELRHSEMCSDVRQFCARVFPRLQRAIQEQLELERTTSTEQTTRIAASTPEG